MGAHETFVGMFRRADHGLPAHIKRGIYYHGTARLFPEFLDDIIKVRICVPINRLNSGAVVNVRDCRHIRSAPIEQLEHIKDKDLTYFRLRMDVP